MTTGALLELEGITRGYAAPGGGRVEVLKGVDLRMEEGEIVAVTGPSGSGKSTLLNIVGTLDVPDAGSFRFMERDIPGLKGRELFRFRNREIGFVFQSHHLLPHLTVLENVLMPTLINGGDGAEERARRLLDSVGIGNRLDHRPGELSVGECQRTAVVRALINSPRLLLADEPTGSLDGQGAGELGNLLAGINRREGTTLLTVTHSSELARKAARVLELKDGILSPVTGP